VPSSDKKNKDCQKQSLFFEPLVGLNIRKTCRWQAYKENLQQSSESKLSLTAEDSL